MDNNNVKKTMDIIYNTILKNRQKENFRFNKLSDNKKNPLFNIYHNQTYLSSNKKIIGHKIRHRLL